MKSLILSFIRTCMFIYIFFCLAQDIKEYKYSNKIAQNGGYYWNRFNSPYAECIYNAHIVTDSSPESGLTNGLWYGFMKSGEIDSNSNQVLKVCPNWINKKIRAINMLSSNQKQKLLDTFSVHYKFKLRMLSFTILLILLWMESTLLPLVLFTIHKTFVA